jgi:hypothetical protein
MQSTQNWKNWRVADKLKMLERLRAQTATLTGQPTRWTLPYRNSERGKTYTPHSQAERDFITAPHRNKLAKGGEGSGKSVLGIICALERLRRGGDGIFASPDFEHFKRSLWPEFRRWCVWEHVAEKDRYKQSATWEASRPFQLHFNNERGTISTLYCGGIEDPSAWEGPNVSFAVLDEIRRHRTPAALKVMNGRVRIPLADGGKPDIILTTTPRKHWLYDYFGELKDNDPLADFKADALVITLSTEANELAGNLSQGYTQQRGQSLTESEKRVLLLAEWEDIDEVERFLPSIAWWDGCKADLPPLTKQSPVVIGLDAGVTNDFFALVAVGRHPTRKDTAQVRAVRVWKPRGKALDFDAIESEIGELCKGWNVLQFAYDPYQLHQMGTRLGRNVAWAKPFSQTKDRAIADKQLLDMIQQRRIEHDGNDELRQALDNANRKTDQDTKTLRIVKRSENLKIDLGVALSMAVSEVMRLNL